MRELSLNEIEAVNGGDCKYGTVIPSTNIGHLRN